MFPLWEHTHTHTNTTKHTHHGCDFERQPNGFVPRLISLNIIHRLQISEVKQCKRVYFFDLSKHFGNFISFTDSENQSHITIINASTSKANHFKVTYRSTLFFINKFCLSFNFIEK